MRIFGTYEEVPQFFDLTLIWRTSQLQYQAGRVLKLEQSFDLALSTVPRATRRENLRLFLSSFLARKCHKKSIRRSSDPYSVYSIFEIVRSRSTRGIRATRREKWRFLTPKCHIDVAGYLLEGPQVLFDFKHGRFGDYGRVVLVNCPIPMLYLRS